MKGKIVMYDSWAGWRDREGKRVYDNGARAGVIGRALSNGILPQL